MTLQTAAEIESNWKDSPRWKGVKRGYSGCGRGATARHACTSSTRSRGSGAEKLWRYMQELPFVNALGALTGNQAMQQVRAGLKAIYLSGWQVAGDANLAGEMYPDQSLYPGGLACPQSSGGSTTRCCAPTRSAMPRATTRCDWLQPIVADAEAGFGGVLNAFELMKAMIDAGAAGVHFEDQLSSAKKCGHMGGKVLVPTQEAINKLVAARLAADVCGVPTVLVARTDAESATLLTSDVDERDHAFIASKERTAEGFFPVNAGIPQAIARGLAYAPYRGPHLVRDGHARPARGAGNSPRASIASTRASCSLTTARRPSTGGRSSTTRRSPSSSANSAPWATSSSSSRWRVSTRSTSRCSSWRAATRMRR